jgi:ATP phosphoribosyltransferase-like protein
MRAAGLEVVSEIFSSQAIMFQQLPNDENGLAGKKGELIELILKRITGYMTATRNTMVTYNCKSDNLQACCQITPGKRSPTITDLKEEGWHSVSSLVEKSKLNGVLDELSAAGAVDILCTALSNTRM